jgi:penicillin-insensitive murein DD-endopeptidase
LVIRAILRPTTTLCIAIAAGLAWLLLPAASVRADALRTLPPRFQQTPFTVMSLTVGYPNNGWQLRAKRLRRSGHLALKNGSRERAYAHPALVLMLDRSARQVSQTARGSVMLVGDLSRRDGGPLPGHTSHQSGRDADVGFYVKDAKGRPLELNEFVTFAPTGQARDGREIYFDDWRNWLLVQAWVKDSRAGLSHIFVATWLRRRLLDYAEHQARFRKYVPQATLLLKQPEDAAAHDDHFHVRISCPEFQRDICREESR